MHTDTDITQSPRTFFGWRQAAPSRGSSDDERRDSVLVIVGRVT